MENPLSMNSNTRAKRVLTDAMALSEDERLLVATELLASLEGPDDDMDDDAWLAEVHRRAERAIPPPIIGARAWSGTSIVQEVSNSKLGVRAAIGCGSHRGGRQRVCASVSRAKVSSLRNLRPKRRDRAVLMNPGADQVQGRALGGTVERPARCLAIDHHQLGLVCGASRWLNGNAKSVPTARSRPSGTTSSAPAHGPLRAPWPR